MKINLYLFCVFFLILTISCSEKERKEKEILKFKTGIPLDRSLMFGLIQNKKEDLIYFTDVNTSKQIKFFNDKGGFFFSIHLDSLIKKMRRNIHITPITIDSIIVREKYTNRFCHINKTGELKNEVQLDTIFPPVDSNFKYELSQSYTGKPYTENLFFLFINWRYQFSLEDELNLNSLEKTRKFYYSIRKKPLLLKTQDLFSEKIQCSFGCEFEDIYFNDSISSLYNYDSLYMDWNNYLILNGKIFIKSLYSDRVFISDLDFNILDTVRIVSKYTSIGGKRLSLDNSSSNLQKYYDEHKLVGKVNQIFYNEQRKKYYVIVEKEVAPEFYQKEQYRPWVLQEFDSSFNFLKETPYFENKYKSNILNLKKGIFIELNEEKEIDNFEDYEVSFEKYIE